MSNKLITERDLKLVEKEDILEALDKLSTLCYEKSNYIVTNYPKNVKTILLWDTLGNMINDCVSKVISLQYDKQIR